MLWVPCSSGEGADGLGADGGMGVSLDRCTCTCMHTHAWNAKINMLGNWKWPPPWRQPCLSCLTCTHVCAHVHACMCMHMHLCIGGALTQSQPHPPTDPPPGGYPEISKITIKLERIKIFRFHLKIWNLWRLPHPWVGVFVWWVGGWVG